MEAQGASSAAAARWLAGEGDRVWFLGNLMTIKHGLGDEDETTFIEAELRAGHAPPLHLHEHEDEAFYLLAGAMRFRCGAEEFEAGPGDYVFVPRGVAHAFKVAGGGARTIQVASSPLLARFIVAGGQTATGAGAPAPTKDEMERVIALAREHDMIVLGPPLL